MGQTSLYARFLDAKQAQRALVALVDKGASLQDLAAMFPASFQVRDLSKTAAEQAVASITGSCRANAEIGRAGSTSSAAVVGLMQDQGVPQRLALDTLAAVKNGTTVVTLNCPTGRLSELEVSEILSKFQGETFGRLANQCRPLFRPQLRPGTRPPKQGPGLWA